MGHERNKKGRRDPKVLNPNWSLEAADLEQTITILKAAGALNADTITIAGSTAQADMSSLELMPESVAYKKDRWKPKLTASPNELEAQRRAENRLRRRTGII